MTVNRLLLALLFVWMLVLGACSFENDESSAGNHVWKSQTDALQKARDTEQLLANEVKEKQRKIEQQSQ
jgi:hypothetical protein